MKEETDQTAAHGGMRHRFKLYAALLPYLLRFIPATVRTYTAFVFHAVLHAMSSILLLLLSPFIYMAERYHASQIRLPRPYRHVLITGASSGAGEGLAYKYSAPGVHLTLIARDAEQLHLVATKCRTLGANPHVVVQDVTDQQGMERVVEEAEKLQPLDLVMAVAGHEASMGSDEDIVGASRQVIQVNVIGMMNTILPCIPHMRKRRRGQLVLFSSQLGFIAAPLAADYDSAKVCIRLYGEGLRTLLYPYNIAVNVVVPGGMITPMMNSLTERGQIPTVPFILPVPVAVKYIEEGLRRNVGVIAFPSVMTAFNAAVGAWPAQARDLALYLMTTEHHIKWRMGEVSEYRDRGGGKGKEDHIYVKEREAEKKRQSAQKGTRKEL